jgi:hypothetical protein
MNKSGAIGTATETAIVKVLRDYWPHAERRRLRGAEDWGDITGTHPKLVWEVKGGAAAKAASDVQIDLWLLEADDERINAGAEVGVLVIPRKGIGPRNAHRWWAIFDTVVLSRGFDTKPFMVSGVRLHLGEACELLKGWGY